MLGVYYILKYSASILIDSKALGFKIYIITYNNYLQENSNSVYVKLKMVQKHSLLQLKNGPL